MKDKSNKTVEALNFVILKMSYGNDSSTLDAIYDICMEPFIEYYKKKYMGKLCKSRTDPKQLYEIYELKSSVNYYIIFFVKHIESEYPMRYTLNYVDII